METEKNFLLRKCYWVHVEFRNHIHYEKLMLTLLNRLLDKLLSYIVMNCNACVLYDD